MYKTQAELGNQPLPNRDQYSILDLQNEQHKSQIISQNRLVCVDIYADWCGPCRMISPEFSLLAEKYNRPGFCMLVKENLEKGLTKNVGGVPTFHFYLQGKLVDEIVGGDLQGVEQKIKQYLQNAPMQGPLQPPIQIPEYKGAPKVQYNEPLYASQGANSQGYSSPSMGNNPAQYNQMESYNQGQRMMPQQPMHQPPPMMPQQPMHQQPPMMPQQPMHQQPMHQQPMMPHNPQTQGYLQPPYEQNYNHPQYFNPSQSAPSYQQQDGSNGPVGPPNYNRHSIRRNVPNDHGQNVSAGPRGF